MLNRTPIFLNCFSRGGSNILWNVFLTHPDVASPILETLEIFRTGIRKPKLAGYKLALLSRQPRLLDQWNLNERPPVPAAAKEFFDQELYKWKVKTLEHPEMKFKTETEIYTLEEAQNARLVSKNNNGTIFLTPMLREMYPDSTFIALTRDPFALYESFKRRGIISEASAFAQFYNRLAGRMLEDRENLPRYHLMKFEDLLADPLASTSQLYDWTNLDASKVTKLRFKAKPHLQKDGSHGTQFQSGHHYWFKPDEVYSILEKDINTFSADRLAPEDRAEISRLCGPVLKTLGYDVG
jgi:hypothetical protein